MICNEEMIVAVNAIFSRFFTQLHIAFTLTIISSFHFRSSYMIYFIYHKHKMICWMTHSSSHALERKDDLKPLE